MPLKRYVVLAAVGTLLCWTAWMLVLFFIDPLSSGFIGLGSFYVSLFLALLGTFSLLGFLFRRVLAHSAIAYHQIGISVRQGFLLALLVNGALLLRGTSLYAWWNLVLLVGGFTLLEFFFLTKEST